MQLAIPVGEVLRPATHEREVSRNDRDRGPHGANLGNCKHPAPGLLGGRAAPALTRVYRNPATGRPASGAGWGYAAFWTLVIGARAAFSYGAAHWFTGPLVSWAAAS